MANKLFLRRWKISVYLNSGDVLVVSNSDLEVQSGALQVTFNINRPGYQAFYYGDIVIYNLNGSTEREIIKEGNRVVVEAGYIEGAYGKIFDGQVFQVFRERENVVDYKLTLHCLDGMGIFDNNMVSFTVYAGTDQRSQIASIAANATKPIPLGTVSQNIDTKVLPRGKTFFGQPKDYFRDIANYNNAQCFIHDGQVHMTKLSDGPQLAADEAIVFTPTTGLIGTPQVTQDGVQFTVLLDPRVKIVNPSMLVKLDMTLLRKQLLKIGQLPTLLDNDGLYQVVSVAHRGDTRGNEWYTDIVGCTTFGLAPFLVQNAQQSPN